jgi:hypothetical protein
MVRRQGKFEGIRSDHREICVGFPLNYLQSILLEREQGNAPLSPT